MPFRYTTWKRYLAVFPAITLLARVDDCITPPAGACRVDGEGLNVVRLPPYSGPIGFLRAFVRLHRIVSRAAKDDVALLVRVPSPIASFVVSSARRARPYAVEVVGDPFDVLAPGVVEHALRPLLRILTVRQLRRACANATVAIYVTREKLQARYPMRSGGTAFVASNVELIERDFLQPRKPFTREAGPHRIVTVASLEQRYKGVGTLLQAADGLLSEGFDVRVTVVGTGRYASDLIRQAEMLGIVDRVTFAGEQSKEGVHRALDQADFFVLASRTEGLPRAMLEAMARGLPCIGTAVGGIPELLGPEELVRPNDPDALQAALAKLISDPGRVGLLSARNIATASSYRHDVLAQERHEAYLCLAEATEHWRQRKHR